MESFERQPLTEEQLQQIADPIERIAAASPRAHEYYGTDKWPELATRAEAFMMRRQGMHPFPSMIQHEVEIAIDDLRLGSRYDHG